MIPGDIDLTEKLDFRKTVRKELPQLPDTWKGNKSNNISVDSSMITELNSSSDYSFSISSNSTITHTYRVNYADWFTSTSWTTINNDEDLHITNNDIIIEWNNENTLNFSLLLDSESITYSREDKFYEPKEEVDIFGNKIVHEYIPKIPWKEESVERIPSIPWDSKPHGYISYKDKLISYEDNWRLPRNWTFEDDEIEDIEFDQSNPYKKAKHLISWLFGKSLSFIDNYLDNDKEADLSYLTNMSWIRVRDAVID